MTKDKLFFKKIIKVNKLEECYFKITLEFSRKYSKLCVCAFLFF